MMSSLSKVATGTHDAQAAAQRTPPPGGAGTLRARLARLPGWVWVMPAVLLIFFVQIGPMLYALWLSLYERRSLAPSGKFVGLRNYLDQLSSGEFWQAVKEGMIYAFGSVFLQLALGLATALLLHRQFRGRGLARAIALLPYMIPTTAAALIFALITNNLYGVADQILIRLHLIHQAILFYGDQHWAMPAVILTAAWKWTPFAVIVLLSRLQAIDESMYESARVEGAGSLRSFLDITLPSLRSAIFLIVLLRSIWMFNKFDFPYLLTQGGPLDATTNVPIYAYNVNFLQYQQGMGATLSIVMSLFLLIFAIPYFLIFKPEEEVSTE